MPGRTDDKIRCSFCGKTQDQVRKLIAGTDNVYICDDCIELCSEILEEEFADQEKGPDFSGINLLKPKEIKEFLDEYVIGQDDAKNLHGLPVRQMVPGAVQDGRGRPPPAGRVGPDVSQIFPGEGLAERCGDAPLPGQPLLTDTGPAHHFADQGVE